MRLRRSIIIFAAAMALAAVACTKYIYVYTVGELDNPIQLVVGMFGASSAQTKAEGDSDAGAQYVHGKHQGFVEGNKIRLRVDGTWQGHGTSGTVSQTTVATLAAESGNHNAVSSYDSKLYWDDYGTADPTNTAGRNDGLTIYGVAINDKDSTVPDVDGESGKQWTALTWELPANQSGEGEGNLPWTRSDLVISNNVRYIDESHDNRYQFDARLAGKLLEFTHAMSKITIQVKPGGGFDGDFKQKPTIEFQIPFKMSGSVNIETGAVTPNLTVTPGANIKLKYGSAPTASPYVHSYDGLIMPGNEVSDGLNLLKVSADGNDYYISTQQLRAAMSTASGDFLFHSGKNYIVLIQLGKTALEVTATIVDWENVTAEMVNPSINVIAAVGGTDGHAPTATTNFSFFERVNGKVDDLYGTASGSPAYYAADAVLTYNSTAAESSRWSLEPRLYWPDHDTHLHMRGVYPQVGTSSESALPVVTGDAVANQSIAVSNAAYVQGTFPSDLMLGKPEVGDATCPSNSHTSVLMKDHGICATTGRINLTFKYMMSQVEVRLKTAVPITHDAATPADAVDLTNAEVAVIGIQSSGSVTLDDIVMTPSGDRTTKESPYVIPPVASGDPRDYIPTANIRHAAIVPQSLIYNTNQDAQFKITLKTGDAHDVPAAVYYVKIRDLMHGLVPATPENKWEAGRHYIYTFDLRRTGVEVTATVVDWVQADAESDVWM